MREHFARISAIYISPDAGQPMERKLWVKMVAGRGISGDRYFDDEKGAFSSRKDKNRQIAMAASEDIQKANRISVANGGDVFSWKDTRRNIITTGIDLKRLKVGTEIRVGRKGKVRLRVTGPCAPCDRPSHLSDKPGFTAAFKDKEEDRGGVRLEVITGGTIRIWNRIRVEDVDPVTS